MKSGNVLDDGVLDERVSSRGREGKGETLKETSGSGRSGDSFRDSVSGGDPDSRGKCRDRGSSACNRPFVEEARQEDDVQGIETRSSPTVGGPVGKVVEQLVSLDGEGIGSGSVFGALLARDLAQAKWRAERDET
jgi:hypothetical protein